MPGEGSGTHRRTGAGSRQKVALTVEGRRVGLVLATWCGRTRLNRMRRKVLFVTAVPIESGSTSSILLVWGEGLPGLRNVPREILLVARLARKPSIRLSM